MPTFLTGGRHSAKEKGVMRTVRRKWLRKLRELVRSSLRKSPVISGAIRTPETISTRTKFPTQKSDGCHFLKECESVRFASATSGRSR